MTESVEVSVARMQEIMRMMQNDVEEAKRSRRIQYDKIDEIGKQITVMSARIETVESQLAQAAPTLSEFVILKQRAMGAGALGRWLWTVGAFLIGAAAWAVGVIPAIRNWFMGN